MPDRYPTHVAGWFTLPLLRVRVLGSSMAPTVRPGDRLLVARWARWHVGSVVALPDPRAPERVLIKRVRAIDAGGVDVRGDNEAASTDTRTFGLVAPSKVAGRVVYRYLPADRAGRI